MDKYGREDVLRILRVPSRQLSAWQKAGLVASAPEFSFEQLAQLRKLRDLTATRISVSRIRTSVAAMQAVGCTSNPLLQAVVNGSRLAFRQGGALVDPVTRQMAFDFEHSPGSAMAVVRARAAAPSQLNSEAQEMFIRAVRLEERPETLEDAKELYREILKLQPSHAPAAINLGTIFYNERDFLAAETCYRQATVADSEYALAFFDLGNVLDELQRLPEAIDAYERALELVPSYADVHYNLALAYERRGESRRALRHWTEYARLDPSGPWAAHARTQAKKILSGERLAIVTRHGRTMRIAG